MAGKFGWWGLLLLLWVVPLLGLFGVLFFVQGTPLEPGAQERKELRVYSSPNYYRKLDKPAEFGLEKVYSLVNYLLLASAAVLAFTTKSLMDYRSERAQGHNAAQPKRYQLLLLLHAGIACFYSLLYGITAYMSLPDITVIDTFALTGQFSICVFGQCVWLLFAVVLLLVALGGVVRGLLP